jgi:hypothetical protein
MKANKIAIKYRLGEKGKELLLNDFMILRKNLDRMKKEGAEQDEINEEEDMIRTLMDDIRRIENLRNRKMVLDKKGYTEDRKIYFDRLKNLIKEKEIKKQEKIEERPIRFEDILILMDKIVRNHRKHTILSKEKKYSVLEPYYDESLFYEYSALEKLYYSQDIFSIKGCYLFLEILKIMRKYGMNKLTRGLLSEKEKKRMDQEIKELTEILEEFKERPDCDSPYLRDRFIARGLKRDLTKESLLAMKYWLGARGKEVLINEIMILRKLLEKMKKEGAEQDEINMVEDRIKILMNDIKRIEDLEKNIKISDRKSSDENERIYFDKLKSLMKKGEMDYWRKKKLEFDKYIS